MRVHSLWLCFVCVAMVALPVALGAEVELLPPDLRTRGGLCVIVGGADDIAPPLDLLDAGPWVIHWLDARPGAVDSARSALRERGVYGRVSVESWDRDSLPHADNLVNLIVVRDAAQAPKREEMLRALAPEGSLFVPSGDGFARIDKPRPPEMGDWTHPWHDADGSLLSNDRALEPPNAFQWVAGPTFPLANRRHSTGAVLSAGGRVFYVTQNAAENIPGGGPNYIVARDAFNGVPLWSHPWEGPLSAGTTAAYHEAIVVSEARVYAARESEVVVLDAATGEVFDTWPTADTPRKLVRKGSLLIAESSAGLTGLDLTSGEPAWHFEADDPWGVLAGDGRAFCLVGTREEDGRWKHELLAVDLEDGGELWRRPLESEYTSRAATAELRLHFAGEGLVFLIERERLRMLSAEDGRELWGHESGAAHRRDGQKGESRMVGHFYVGGKLWIRETKKFRARDGARDTGMQETWRAVKPQTGEVLRELTLDGPQGPNTGKGHCQALTASERFVLDGRHSTIWDFETGTRSLWTFARGGCRVGQMAANGLIYVPPNACGCLSQQLRGNLALTHSRDVGVSETVPAELERGPAYGSSLSELADGASPDWPTYRRDGRRGAYLPGNVPLDMDVTWSAKLSNGQVDTDPEWHLHSGRPLTPPVVAGGLVLLAEPQTHQVIALDEATGAERWRFTAGGRVTVPPTVYRGMALFGSRNGYVYALRATDGSLAWRRRVAPSHRRIMAYGQVESAWPVDGGVLIHEGRALVASGRAADADGGLVVQAFDPETGELLWDARLTNARYGMCDVLVTDGEHVYLMDQRLDTQTGESSEVDGFNYLVRSWTRGDVGTWRIRFPEGVRYLRSGKAGLMETSWTWRASALRKGQSTWMLPESEGELLAFNDRMTYAYQVDADRIWGAGGGHDGGGRIEARRAFADAAEWSFDLPRPAQVEAMLATQDAIFAGGPEDRNEPGGVGFLRVLASEDGRELSSIALPAAPVHDGMAAANGSVFVVLRDGRVLRLSEE